MVLFCGPAKPEGISDAIANAAALDKACEAWTKTIHTGTRYRPDLGEGHWVSLNKAGNSP
jgi:hypothetical protein